MIVPIILGGGEGKRLWPLSRQYFPKQLQNLLGDRSLLQHTIMRMSQSPECIEPIIISNKNYRFILEQQINDINCVPSQLILEAETMNTTFAITLAALWAKKKMNNPMLLILPCDHLITDEPSFLTSVVHAAQYLEQHNPNTSILFGTQPTSASTQFGYIKARALQEYDIKPIEKFIEKPELALAKQLVKEPDYFWNTGIFLFYTDHVLAELKQWAPDVYECAELALSGATAEKHTTILPEARVNVLACEKISIDYALFEQSKKSMVTLFPGAWYDVGNWTSLYQAMPKDADGNVKIGDVTSLNTKDCYLRSSSRLVTAVGLTNQTVVETPDAVLVVDNQHAHEISSLVAQLTSEHRQETQFYPKVIKPWGSFEVLYANPHVQIKKLKINPGASISTQLHKCRSEHWIVMAGKATVLKDSRSLTLLESQSTYIPIGVKHRLSNDTSEPLELIEVQLGSYLFDDDIIRFEDQYARTTDEI
jgi:mannose-1-phosphate guanylyltransferase/mannose-6-phosphate isomerase